MGEQTAERWEHSFRTVIQSIIGGVLITVGVVLLQSVLGFSIPSIDLVTDRLWIGIQSWADFASVESPKTFALNTMILVTFTSAILNSWNRKSESSTISGILVAPGMAEWSELFTKLVDTPFIGTIVYSLGVAVRLYLWFYALLLFFVYPIIYVESSNISMFVVTVTVILASVTFGTVFGRLEKGIVLSVKSTADSIRSGGLSNKSKYRKIGWSLVVPGSLLIAGYITKVRVSLLEDPTYGEVIASSTSVFLTTSLALIALLYVLATAALFAAFCRDLVFSFRDRSLQEAVKARWTKYIQEEFRRGDSNETQYGFPEEIADALRRDHEE